MLVQKQLRGYMSKTKQTQLTLDPMAPTKTKTSVACLELLKALLKAGNGKVSVKDLAAKVGGPRRGRHAVWLARYVGIKLDPVRNGRVVEAYVHTGTYDVPQTKHIPVVFKSHWHSVREAKAAAAGVAKVQRPVVAKPAVVVAVAPVKVAEQKQIPVGV